MGKFRSSSRVAWLSALILIFGIGSAQADKRVALVIGNSQYTLISPKLANPSNDAHDLAEALKGIGFEVILKTDIGKGDFDRSLAEFARKASGADTALFYYAGHGLQYQRQNYFLPVDIKVEDAPDVEFTAIGMDRVLEAIDKANGVKVLILDACRDNPLAKQVLTRGVGGSGELMRGLARLDRTEGLIIAYATAPDQVAQDGSGRNSPFTEALIRRIKEPGLEIGTMFRRVTSDVFERTNGRQRPEISISLLTDYFLNPSVADSIEWGRIRNSDDEDVFKTFIRKYPESPYARDAQYRIDLFERIKREQQDRVAREEEQKLKDEEAKRQKEEAEKERQRIVDLCAADRAKLSGLVVGLQSDAIQKLGKETACPTLQPDVDKAFKDVNLKLAEEQKRKDEEARRQKEEADKEKQRIAGLCDR
ncbi:MAG: caspase family protein, partial [Alphaproteobacteria bacterium]|nr:caspase family protein [Alphaproteobacteria bacterium]